MPFVRPTLAELIDRVESDGVSRLELDGTTTILRRAMARIVARLVAGAAHMLHGHMEYLSKQILPDLSDEAYLLRFAALFGQAPDAATYAHRTATATGTNGSVISAAEVVTSSDGVTFTVDADVTIASGTATIALTATDAGTTGNVPTGATLTFQSPPAGVNSSVTVLAGGTDASDAEDVGTAFRARFLAYLQAPPHGGNETDYVEWAKAALVNVTRAWVYPKELGAGQITVRIACDNDAGGPIPTSGEVAAVQAYIDNLRPATATVNVLAPVADPVTFSIHIVPNNTTTQAAVTSALQDFFTRNAQPGGTEELSQIELAVGLAAGVTDYSISLINGLTPANVVHTTGKLGTLGTITWV